MNRSHRSELARETLAICEAGFYLSPDGRQIELRPLIDAAVSSSVLCSLDAFPQARLSPEKVSTRLRVTDETTIEALQRLDKEEGGHLACLNFASAKNAGGGFLGGSQAQEESLARSSALYPCLLAVRDYYERNRACRTALYLDMAIWSEAVPFFRDDDGMLLPCPITASVITAPAPNAGAVCFNEPERAGEIEPTLRRRAALVLSIAAAYGVRRFVLGAWGCGVFRNDPRMVARVFAELLCGSGEFAGVFAQV
ncbi:MAG: TIGR02452 family protein, partial [Verrucomicrobiota bacterium]